MVLVTIAIFIGLLLVLVLVHEFGHFYAAKKAGCKVEEFGFGFPPRLFAKQWGDTLYSVNALPLGGFVKIEGEDMDTATPGPTSFASKSATWRVIILAAGVFMNVVLAWVLLTVQGVVGVPTLIQEDNPNVVGEQLTYVVDVMPASPAAQAGLQALDRIVQIEDTEQPTISEVQSIVSGAQGAAVSVTVDRQGVRHTLEVMPRTEYPSDQGPLGIGLAATGLIQVPWWQAPWHGIVRTWSMLVAIITQFGVIIQQAFTSGSLGSALTGPVGIAVYTQEVAQLGASYVLEFATLISLNLAIINILPLPALDGGRIVFVLIEKVRGRRMAGAIERWSHTIGFIVLIGLMLLITFKDVQRFF